MTTFRYGIWCSEQAAARVRQLWGPARGERVTTAMAFFTRQQHYSFFRNSPGWFTSLHVLMGAAARCGEIRSLREAALAWLLDRQPRHVGADRFLDFRSGKYIMILRMLHQLVLHSACSTNASKQAIDDETPHGWCADNWTRRAAEILRQACGYSYRIIRAQCQWWSKPAHDAGSRK